LSRGLNFRDSVSGATGATGPWFPLYFAAWFYTDAGNIEKENNGNIVFKLNIHGSAGK
jgi:hypothetical protein